MRSVLSIVFALAIAACGGASETGLFTGDGTGGSGGDGGGASGNRDGGAGPDASNGGGDAGGGDDGGGTQDDGGSRVDSGSGGDASRGDSGVGVDSGPVDPGIYCGKVGQTTVYCQEAQQDCCATDNGGQVPTYVCVPAQSMACLGLTIGCDDTADCHGQICCGDVDQQTQRYRDVSCRTTCDARAPNGDTQLHLCDPALRPTDCPQGLTCQPSTLLPGYHVCR